MANKNTNLHLAKKAKCDEFYTQYKDIESELKHYTPQFEGKTVYCNCDNPDASNFTKYFKDNFDTLKLKRLISTGYNANGHGKALDYDGQGKTTELQGNGDFRSQECIELLKQADIVVTNPPFSLFRAFIATMEKYSKKYLVIGNMNAITYKEIFPLLKDGKMWMGMTFNKTLSFKIPNEYKKYSFIENDVKIAKVPSIAWFTNMETNKQNYPKCLIKSYNPTDYPQYDNYNAINVDKVKDIPYDYEGVIGVPITILNDLCSDGLLHFEAPLKKKNVPNHQIQTRKRQQGLVSQRQDTILQNPHPTCTGLSELTDTLKTTRITESGSESTEKKSTQESSFNVYRIVGNEYSLDIEKGRGYVNGKRMYSRIFIQRVN